MSRTSRRRDRSGRPRHELSHRYRQRSTGSDPEGSGDRTVGKASANLRIVITELWVAIGKGTETEHNREKFERLLGGLPQVDLTEPIAKRAGEIEGDAQSADQNGVGVGMADAILAATALEFDEPVVTDDGDFVKRVQELPGCGALAVDRYASNP
jgi:predicted nucleic acid-binding protein